MRVYQLADGRVVKSGEQFTANELNYPAHWLELATPDDLTAHGITVLELDDPNEDWNVPTIAAVPAPSQNPDVVAQMTQPTTIIETREEIDPEKLRAMVLVMLEEQNEAVAYSPTADPAQFPLLSKRADKLGVTLAQAAASVIDELAAIKK